MEKNKILVQKTITIVIVVALLFTTGFVLGAVTAEIKELNAPVAEQVTESTTVPTTEATTQAPTTQAPTTAAPTTAAPTTAAPTTEPTTEATTAEPSTEATTEATTEAATEETTEEEPCFLIKIILAILDIKKQIIDFVISLLSSL